MRIKLSIFFIILLLLFSVSCKKNKPDDINPKPNEPPSVEYSIDISIDKSTIYIDDSLTIVTKTSPENAEVIYTFADTLTDSDVIKLEGNVITGLLEGKATVTATLKDHPTTSASLTIKVEHHLLELEDYSAECIVTAPGEDFNHGVNIHYIIRNTKSFALVTTADDPEFNNAEEFYGSGYYFADSDPLTITVWEPRNVWDIPVTGLEENTEYIYKIDNGNGTYSETYSFRTAGGDTTSFLFITDNHYYTGSNETNKSATLSEETIKNALAIDPNINFVLGAGDRIDTGGNDDIWKKYFTLAQSIKTLPFIDAPGNHEYYFNDVGQRDFKYYANYNGAPRNGPESLLGSASWFKHNDTLFIMVDNIRNIGYEDQMKWMSNLLETVDYKTSVITFHAPVDVVSESDYDQKFIDLFDKYGVDLVLTGHYHSQSMKIHYYNNQKVDIELDPYIGTTYLRGTFSGIKSASSIDNAINEAVGYIIDIDDHGITVRRMLANGTVTKTWDIPSIKNCEYQEATKQELKDAISTTFDNNNLTFNFNSKFYGNVKKVSIQELNFHKLDTEVVFPTTSYTSYTYKNLEIGYDYKFDLTIEYIDGTIDKLTFDIDNHPILDITINKDLFMSDLVLVNINNLGIDYKYKYNTVKVIVNDQLYNTYSFLDTNDIQITEFYFEDLTAKTNYNVKFEFYDVYNTFMFDETFTFTTPE